MRLIEADKLNNTIMEQELWNVPEFVYDSIRKAPTVKAILIGWIENKLKCCDNINAEIFVKSLIRDWEKENGRS